MAISAATSVLSVGSQYSPIGSTLTSRSFTPVNNSLVVLVCAGITASGTDYSASLAVSGGSLTWTKRVVSFYTGSGYESFLIIATAQVTTGSSMTAAISGFPNGSDDHAAVGVWCYTGYDTGNPVRQSKSSVAQTGSNTPVQFDMDSAPLSSSVLFAAANTCENGGGDAGGAVGSGWTELFRSNVDGGYLVETWQEKRSTTSPTIRWEKTLTTDSIFLQTLGAIEIQAAGAAAATSSPFFRRPLRIWTRKF